MSVPAGLEVGRYGLPLACPLTVGPTSTTLREGALLRSPEGALADVCPLPGLSPASLEEELARLSDGLAPGPALSWAQWALEHAPVAAEAIGGELAVETALLIETNRPVPALDGPRVLKVKVGRGPLGHEAAVVRALANAGHTIRLDGNRRLSPLAAYALADAAGAQLAFLEEPVGPAHLREVATALPVALDETIAETSNPDDLPPAAAWVLKPTLLGAERTLAWVAAAAARDLPVIISSCFESAVGRLALAQAAHRWAPDVAHGLGTAGWFSADVDDAAALDRITFVPARRGEA